jgi:hypothetical protein
MVNLFSLEHQKTNFSDIMRIRRAKFSILGKTRKGRIKFHENEEEKQDKLNLMQTDILPYSLHYNLVVHPKNYDLSLAEMAKLN